MKVALAIFAKDSTIGEVKTRLAAETNIDFATAFYEICLDIMQNLGAEVKRQTNNLNLFWALAQKEALLYSKWNQNEFKPLWTTSKDLSLALNHIYQTLFDSHDIVILIGSDSPTLSQLELVEVIKKLNAGAKKTIVGPSFDGGFYLFASNQKIDAQIWQNIEYSSKQTLKQLKSELKKQSIECETLKEILDIDDLKSLKQLTQQLQSSSRLNAH